MVRGTEEGCCHFSRVDSFLPSNVSYSERYWSTARYVFSPDGSRFILIGGRDVDRVCVFSLDSPRLLWTAEVRGKPSVSINSHHLFLLNGSRIDMLDLKSGAKAKTIELGYDKLSSDVRHPLVAAERYLLAFPSKVKTASANQLTELNPDLVLIDLDTEEVERHFVSGRSTDMSYRAVGFGGFLEGRDTATIFQNRIVDEGRGDLIEISVFHLNFAARNVDRVFLLRRVTTSMAPIRLGDHMLDVNTLVRDFWEITKGFYLVEYFTKNHYFDVVYWRYEKLPKAMEVFLNRIGFQKCS